MRLIKEPLPVFTLEDRYFDKLVTASQICIYAILSRLSDKGIAWSYDLLKRQMESLGISDQEFNEAMNKLIEIGFLVVVD